MTITEIIAALETAMKAVTAITGEVAAQRTRIAALESQVAAHDLQLKSAPDPGPPFHKEN
jgi:hypothetical protein